MLKEIPLNPKETTKPQTTNEQLSDFEIKTFDLLVPRHRALAINPDTFVGKYSPEKIANDKRYVKKKNNSSENKNLNQQEELKRWKR